MPLLTAHTHRTSVVCTLSLQAHLWVVPCAADVLCSCTVATEKLVALTALADQYDVTLLQQLCMDAIRNHAPNHRCGTTEPGA